MGLFDSVSGVAGGVLGAIAGAQGSPSSSNTNSTTNSTVNLRDFGSINEGASGLEKSGYNAQQGSLDQLTNLVNQGPGASAVTDANAAGSQYSNLLQQFINSGGAPSAQNISSGQSYAQSIFAPQQVALQQSFTDQNIAGNRAAARMGRSGADPVLLAKLGVEQTRQQQSLSANQGAFASQSAQQFQGQQLGLSDSLFNLKQNLATQAFNNRSTLLSLGNQLTASERNYRLGTASRTNSTNSQTTGSSGGGLGGAIAGAFAGAGSGFKAAGNISSMFGSTPTAPSTYVNGGINATPG